MADVLGKACIIPEEIILLSMKFLYCPPSYTEQWDEGRARITIMLLWHIC